MSENTDETVNRPSHYTLYEGFEVMDVCNQLRSPDQTPASTWYRANAFKYLARAGWKNPDKEVEDLKKAAHYLQREIDRLEGNETIKEVSQDNQTKGVNETFHFCPVCGDQLYRLIEHRGRYGCVGRGHGWAEILSDGRWGKWNSSAMHIPDDTARTNGHTLEKRDGYDFLRCAQCGHNFVDINQANRFACGDDCRPLHDEITKQVKEKTSTVRVPITYLRCPVCSLELVQDAEDEESWCCLSGHGKVVIANYWRR